MGVLLCYNQFMGSRKIIIDVREPAEYASGHVEDAINIPSDYFLTGDIDWQDFDKTAEVIVYCQSGGRAVMAIEILKTVGFSNLVNGINAENVIENIL